MRGTLRFIDDDLPRAFGDLERPAPARRSRRRVHRSGHRDRRATSITSRRELAPRSQGIVPSGARSVSSRSSARRRHHARTPTACSRSRPASCSSTQEEFRRVASRLNGGDPLAAWAKAKEDHPAAGQLVPVAQQQLAELVDFINRQRIVTDPGRRAGRGRTDAALLPLDVRQHVDAGPVRGAAAARVLLHHRRRSVVAGRAAERAPARFQLRRAVVDLDPRGVSRALPALPAPAPGRLEAAQVDPVLVDGVRRRAGRTTASR